MTITELSFCCGETAKSGGLKLKTVILLSLDPKNSSPATFQQLAEFLLPVASPEIVGLRLYSTSIRRRIYF